MVAAVRVGHEAFTALAGPFHWASELAGGPGDDGFFGVMVYLGAEASADVGGDDTQLVLWDVQHERAHQQADHVRVLAGGIEGEIARRCVEVAERDAGLHGVRNQPVVGQVEFNHLGGVSEHAVDHGLVADHPVVADVAGDAVMHLGCAGRDGIGEVGDGREVSVVDFEQLGGAFGLLLGFRDHHGDRIADVARLTGGDHRMRRFGHRRAILVVDLPAAGQAADAFSRHVGADEDLDHARRRRRRRDVDPVDRGVRPVGALDEGVELAWPVDVVGVVAFAAKEPDVFLAANGCAYAFEAHGRYLRFFFSRAFIRPLWRASTDERRRWP